MAQKSIAQKENNELREYARSKGVYIWQIAEDLGVCEMTLLRWLRFPLPEDKKSAFIKAVDEISKEREG